MIDASKSNVILQGRGNLETSIVWNATANSSGGTVNSATFSILSFNFIAYNISFQAIKHDLLPIFIFLGKGNCCPRVDLQFLLFILSYCFDIFSSRECTWLKLLKK
jgi:Pectinesterase